MFNLCGFGSEEAIQVGTTHRNQCLIFQIVPGFPLPARAAQVALQVAPDIGVGDFQPEPVVPQHNGFGGAIRNVNVAANCCLAVAAVRQLKEPGRLGIKEAVGREGGVALLEGIQQMIVGHSDVGTTIPAALNRVALRAQFV